MILRLKDTHLNSFKEAFKEIKFGTSYSYFRVKLQQRVRFYSLERSSPLLDIGHRTSDIGLRTYKIRHRTKVM